jgi:uncharacterized paraquat-inducible protein A
MFGTEPFRSSQLLQQAHDMGLLNSENTIKCSNCQAVFPEEYGTCPKCSVAKFFQDIQIDFEI